MYCFDVDYLQTNVLQLSIKGTYDTYNHHKNNTITYGDKYYYKLELYSTIKQYHMSLLFYTNFSKSHYLFISQNI